MTWTNCLSRYDRGIILYLLEWIPNMNVCLIIDKITFPLPNLLSIMLTPFSFPYFTELMDSWRLEDDWSIVNLSAYLALVYRYFYFVTMACIGFWLFCYKCHWLANVKAWMICLFILYMAIRHGSFWCRL